MLSRNYDLVIADYLRTEYVPGHANAGDYAIIHRCKQPARNAYLQLKSSCNYFISHVLKEMNHA